MAARLTTATRTSSRTKHLPAIAPQTARTTRAKATTSKPAPEPMNKAASRKLVVNRESPDHLTSKQLSKATTARKTAKSDNTPALVIDTDQELIMAYLRIRPYLGEHPPQIPPYLTHLSDTAVRMSDPGDQQGKQSHLRSSTIAPASTYTFSHVFPPNISQSDFFVKTTLPLVNDLLHGQNGLLFTYGVTNSGKTFTVQGGNTQGSAGILPRSLDVIFNSIEGLHGDGRFRPVRLHGLEPADPQDFKPPQTTPEPALAGVFDQQTEAMDFDSDIDPTVLKVDRNYEYTIWISYAEVYNEKVFDLLASVKDDPSFDLPTANGKPIVLTRTALPLKPSPASDYIDSPIQGKYISGLRQFRVHSASQAKALVKLGQLHRRVFGTLANRESSRSHGMFIIKVVKGHKGDKDDLEALQISRLTLVDLAGSERTKHTHTTGDRLKEAGNINKSLMVLGQCMEVMRSNQRKVAVSLSQSVGHEDQLDTKDIKKTLAVVPFRHSKLTEALMDYFAGDGRVVMIINVNPYDTGYDENSHVMRFAALAKEVYVTPAPAVVHRLPNGLKAPGKATGNTIKDLGPLTLKDPEIAPHPHRRKVTISIGDPESSQKTKETVLEVLEEDEPTGGQNSDEDFESEPVNRLVDALFDEIDFLRTRLFEAEMRSALIEAETRDEVMREMEERMSHMEATYNRRLMKELEQNELKTNAKIDMLHQSGFFASPVKRSQTKLPHTTISEEEEEEDVEMNLIADDESEEASLPCNQGDKVFSVRYYPLSKESLEKGEKTASVNMSATRTVAQALFGETGDKDGLAAEDGESDDEWIPSPKSSKMKGERTMRVSNSSANGNVRVSHIQKGMNILSIERDQEVFAPTESHSHAQTENHEEYNDDECVPLQKKKRQLGKQQIMTEELIEKATFAIEQQATRADSTQKIRRLTGR